MYGGTGNDTFIGSDGTVTATGGTGNDTFWTGSGSMTITEGAGNDTVIFGSGTATVTGGSVTDLYSFNLGHAGGSDIINDFKVGSDQINLFNYSPSATQQQVSGGNTVLTLSDHTSVVLVGLTQLASNSIVYGS